MNKSVVVVVDDELADELLPDAKPLYEKMFGELAQIGFEAVVFIDYFGTDPDWSKVSELTPVWSSPTEAIARYAPGLDVEAEKIVSKYEDRLGDIDVVIQGDDKPPPDRGESGPMSPSDSGRSRQLQASSLARDIKKYGPAAEAARRTKK